MAHIGLRKLARRLRDTSGANMLEAAIITPLLLLVTLAVIDFASLFYCYLALENGVSQATRYAVTGNLMDDPANPGHPLSRQSSLMLAMRNATPTLTIPDTAFTFSHMPLGAGSWTAGVGGPGDIEKVQIDYNWALLTPLISPFFPGGQIHITVDSAMKNEERFQ